MLMVKRGLPEPTIWFWELFKVILAAVSVAVPGARALNVRVSRVPDSRHRLAAGFAVQANAGQAGLILPHS